jgi:hypothetical protein
MMGAFAVIWVFWGTTSLAAEMAICAVGAALVISAVVGVAVIRRARSMPDDLASAPPNLKLFWGSIAFEIVAAVVGINLLNQFGQTRFDMPWLAIVVGIHFFGIGAAFHTSLHHWVGGTMCGVALASLIALPPANPSAADQVNFCDLVVGIGCAMVLWAFTFLSFLHAEKRVTR